jgi:hypothetical protein
MTMASPQTPIEKWEVPQAPLRDDDALGPNEDLDREPDGIPHDVIGYTALFTVFLAMLLLFMVLSRKPVVQVAAIILAAIAIPVLVSTLRNRADRERDRAHPSR